MATRLAVPKVRIMVDDVGMFDDNGQEIEFLVLFKRGDVAMAANAVFDGRSGVPHSRTMELDWRAIPDDFPSEDIGA